jgi:hypothetical protein
MEKLNRTKGKEQTKNKNKIKETRKNKIGEKGKEWEMKGHYYWPSPYPSNSPCFFLSFHSLRIFCWPKEKDA